HAGRYAAEHLFRLWERLVRLSGDPIIGFRMAQFARRRSFGLLGQLLPRCATVLDAFRQVERYSMLVYQGTRIAVATDATSLGISIRTEVPDAISAVNGLLWMMTNTALVPQRMARVDVILRAYDCAFPSPGPAEARRLRERWPVRFDAAVSRVVFD